MKIEIEQLIDRLADKSLTFGCKYLWMSVNGVPSEHDYDVKDLENGRHFYSKWPKIIDGHENEFLRKKLVEADGVEILGHPIRIGDVLDYLYENRVMSDEGLVKLLDSWADCGIKKSLQSIFDSAEWVEWKGFRATAEGPLPLPSEWKPKQPAIRELFESLIKLGL